jgi:hypothetical protein
MLLLVNLRTSQADSRVPCPCTSLPTNHPRILQYSLSSYLLVNLPAGPVSSQLCNQQLIPPNSPVRTLRTSQVANPLFTLLRQTSVVSTTTTIGAYVDVYPQVRLYSSTVVSSRWKNLSFYTTAEFPDCLGRANDITYTPFTYTYHVYYMKVRRIYRSSHRHRRIRRTSRLTSSLSSPLLLTLYK